MTQKKKLLLTLAIVVAFIVFFELIIGRRDMNSEGLAAVIGIAFVMFAMIAFKFIWKIKPPESDDK